MYLNYLKKIKFHNFYYFCGMKTTPFTNIHISLGAKMSLFAGYQMPINYTSITEEHLQVRQQVGVFDVSHMGEFIVRGNNAFELLQFISSNDIAKLSIGKVQYSTLLLKNGGIVDDMLVYQLAENTYMLVVNAANIDKDWSYIVQQNNAFNAELINISEDCGLLAVQGPLATKVLKNLTPIDVENMAYYTFSKGQFASINNILISATGYTGAGGFEIYFNNKHALPIWNAVFEAGKEFNIKPIGLAARDTLRLEKGYCLYGNDIDEQTSPLEAGLSWICQLQKQSIANQQLNIQKKTGLTRKLIGFELLEKGIARHEYPITNKEGTIIGTVTSGSFAPSLNKAIGMGYVLTPYNALNTEINIIIRNKSIAAKIVKMPFYS